MRALRFDPFLPIIGVVGLIVIWYLAVWYQAVDPVLLPSPVDTFRALWNGMAGGRLGFDFMRTLERTILAILIAAAIAIPLGVARLRKGLPLGRVRHRFLPLHPRLGHVPAVPGAVRGRRQDQNFGCRIRGGAGHSVQRRLWGHECPQNAASRRQGDGRLAHPRAHRRHAARVAAADLRRIAQRRVAGARDRGGGGGR